MRIFHTVPMAMLRRGVEPRLVIEDGRGGSGASGLDLVLIKAMARGRQWFEDLVSGRAGSLVEIDDVGCEEGEREQTPDVVHVTTETLTKHVDLPIDWKEQESLLGFVRAPVS